MKVVILTVEEAKKNKLAGAEKLAKNDLLILMSAKAKSEMPATLKEALDEVVCTTDYIKLDSAADATDYMAYLAGFHEAKGHPVFVVSENKPKIAAGVMKSFKCYTSFASVVKADGTKKTSSSSSSSSKKTTSKKKTSSKKKEEEGLAGILSSITEDGLDTNKLVKEAEKALKKAVKNAGK